MEVFQLIIFIVFNNLINCQENPKVNPFSPFIKPVIGGKTSFTCQSLHGSSPLSISWFKDGHEISDSSEIRIRNIEDSSLLIIDSIKSSHSGNYSCKMSNRYGSDTYTSELLVEGPPSWIERPKDIKLSTGQTIEIKCSTASYPKSRINWKKLQDSNWIDIDLINSKNVEIVGDQLIVKDSSYHNNGRYGCSVTNGIEPNLWSEFEMKIEGIIMFSTRIESLFA